MRVAFVENHDSFSWNVIDRLPFERSAVTVCSAPEARTLLPNVDALVIGPGPFDPVRAGLLELVQAAAARALPTLGICLGHQALGQAFGARVVRSKPSHGHSATAHFSASRWLPQVSGPVQVMRYHSLALADVPEPLRVIASLEDGTVMAIEHATLPMLGLQFHPDSYATPLGAQLLARFFGRLPLTQRGAPSPRSAPVAPATTVFRLSELEGQHDFALLGPGFTGGWTLLTGLQPVHGPADLAWCEAEARTPRWFRGQRSQVRLEVDVPPAPLHATLDERGFVEGVAHLREAIARGDVYQVNLTLRATLAPVSGAQLLASLCARGVPRFAAWVKTGGREFVSASPEQLFDLSDGGLHAEPMKGTAPAGMREWLEASQKDRAELAMITDLLRNDLAQLCQPRSVQVTNPRRLIELPYVVQAVSDVVGTLRDGVQLDEVLRVLHPGGSVTGAPRSTALELISQLEPTPRGVYCGALLLTDGDRARCALLIRTAERNATGWTWGVGSGITWGSEPMVELDEVRLKLGPLLSEGTAPQVT